MSRHADFVEDQIITKLNDLCSSNEEVVLIVIACYFGVEEGIDMWLSEKETIFLLSDCVSMMVAHDTCDVLMSLVGFMQCTLQVAVLFKMEDLLCILMRWKIYLVRNCLNMLRLLKLLNLLMIHLICLSPMVYKSRRGETPVLLEELLVGM
ncbi:hypothetical protein MtrunA17_Chr6g0451701 [Medicago truncatula]|uniref:Uncharacterized protein n=1 Tax=Medicago truncatula TaxID=3880 RepID=A0A396HBJ1_MEDTR|nr:hypothetical protein MtrunA17_Chr6g0451701 [Medicago truncatula]